jgi:anthranilate synthase/aminodeoxychorismate synthase-like glutamine amidotransferase
MVLLIDNYDSFTHNLAHLVAKVWKEPIVRRVDTPFDDLTSHRPEAVLLSPGPGRPDDTPLLSSMIQHWLGEVPILGVCLGYQALGLEFGAVLKPSPRPVHGQCSQVVHGGTGLFEACPSPMAVARYHSLCLEWPTQGVPEGMSIEASTQEGLPMSLAFPEKGAWGVQFHPESFLCEAGEEVIKNFRKMALAWRVPN